MWQKKSGLNMAEKEWADCGRKRVGRCWQKKSRLNAADKQWMMLPAERFSQIWEVSYKGFLLHNL